MKLDLLKIYINARKNYKIIKRTYNILERTYDMGISIHPAGQWLLDNMYIIEEQYIDIMESKSHLSKLRLPSIRVQNKDRYIAIYYIADELIEGNKGYTDQNYIMECLHKYQKTAYLTTEEINVFPVMLKIAMIKFIARICLNISNAQLQKIEVENMIKSNLPKYDDERVKKILSKELKRFKEDPSIAEKLKQTNTSFVEYLAIKLKEKGNFAKEFYNILNEEADKIGFTVEEAIVKEHMEIAKTSDYIGRAITGLKNIDSTNFREIFEKVNVIDEIFKEDYTKEFQKCDYKTKTRYRNRVIKLSKKYHLAEIYIAKKAVECSKKYKRHIGFFLSGEDKYILNKELEKSYLGEYLFNNVLKPIKPYLYIFSIIIFAFSISVWFDVLVLNINNIALKIIYYIISFILSMEVSDKFINYSIRKILKPKILPRFDFAKTIDEEYSTYIIMPTVINSFDKIDEMIKKMEITYLANRSDNMYYMLIGDCVSSDQEVLELDKEYVKYAKEKLDVLNSKYKAKHILFNFMYRKRVYSEAENCYMGYERKRGAIKHFNELVLGTVSKKENDKRMYLVYDDIVRTKYAITIDEDTSLSLNTAKDLVAIIAHPLNRPKLSENGKIVKSGHALIQPAVDLDIVSANKSIFSKIFGGFGGLDIYTTAVSNTYQDLFNEAIFCGKGIYDIEVFEKLLANEIPENLVLSHDLLEGSYLRAGLASDIQVQDGFPNNYIAYMKRNHRWYRGDMQIIRWLLPKSPLNVLSKWKILDNLRRPLTNVFALLLLIITLVFNQNSLINVIILVFCTINFGYFLELIDRFLFGKLNYKKELLYIPIIHGTMSTLLNMTYNFITLPYTSYMCLDAFIKSLYRMFVSKKNLLEWTTGEALEKSTKNTVKYYFKSMRINVLIGLIIIIFGILSNSLNNQFKAIVILLGVFFAIAPVFAYLLGKDYLFSRKKNINKESKKEILDIARRTWNFFDYVMTPVNHYLPTDNYQDDRRMKIVNRTSSTNIGMGILAIINAYDLKFIDLEDCVNRIINILGTIDKLEKWNGHLYNWYNIKTLAPLRPRFISTVDSGNFVASLFVLKGFLNEIKDEKIIDKYNIKNIVEYVSELIKNTDFTKVYDASKNLFSIGYNQEEGTMFNSYYDMLISENRTTSYIAIALKQITSKHWFALSRKLTKIDGYKGLVSWSGTAFEYFMPNLFMHSYEHTLIDQSLFLAKYCQMKYVEKLDMPWGISESAFALRDNELNYQYMAFGMPALGLKRGLKDYLVISPYASILMLEYAPVDVYKNIKKLKSVNAYGSYGFYESIDYTKEHLNNTKYEVIKTYMAHHQGMLFTAINNYFNNDIIKERFHSDSNIDAAEILLKERERMKIDINKENIRYKKKFSNENEFTTFVLNKHIDKEYLEFANTETKIALLRGKDISSIVTSNGATYLNYGNKIVNSQRYKDFNNSQNKIFIKDSVSSNIIDITNTDNISKEGYINKTNFYSALNEVVYYIETDDLEIKTTVFLSPSSSMEIRKVSIYNNSRIKREMEIKTYIEPALTDYMTNVVHPSFNNLQIETKYDEELDTLIASKRLKNENDTELFMFAKMVLIDLPKEYLTEKIKFDVNNNENYSLNPSRYPLWAILSYKAKIILDQYERQDFYYVVGVEESKYKLTNSIVNLTKEKLVEMQKFNASLNSITCRYLGLLEGEADNYNNIVKEVLFEEREKEKDFTLNYNQSMLWKYGISGDLPILLVNIESINNITIVDKVIDFVDYIKNRDLSIDVIIIARDKKFSNKVYDYAIDKINKASFKNATKGGIYLFNGDELSKSEIELFEFVAKKITNKVDDFLSDNG